MLEGFAYGWFGVRLTPLEMEFTAKPIARGSTGLSRSWGILLILGGE